MKKTRKILILFILMFIILAFYNIVHADSNLYLNNLKFDAKINEDGSMDVVETWNINIKNTDTLCKNFTIDSAKYKNISDVKVSRTDSNGNVENFVKTDKYSYHLNSGEYYFTRTDSKYELAYGIGYGSSSGTENYIISYHVDGAVGLYNDCAELYWQFLGTDFNISAEKITGTIKLPKEVENIDSIQAWIHNPDLNGNVTKSGNDKLEFEVNNNLPKKMVEIRIAMPRDIIDGSSNVYVTNRLDTILNEEKEWVDDLNFIKKIRSILLLVLILLVSLFIIYEIIRCLKILITFKKKKPEKHYDYLGEIPRKSATPAEAAYIISKSYKNNVKYNIGNVFTSIVLNLALKKAIRLENVEDDYNIILCYDGDNNLSIEEKIVYNYLNNACNYNNEKKSNQILVSELNKYIRQNDVYSNSIAKNIERKLDKKVDKLGFFDENGEKIKNANSMNFLLAFFIGIMIIIMGLATQYFENLLILWMGIVLLFVFSLVLLGIVNSRISAYSQKGINEIDKWKAFEKYMEEISSLDDKDLPDFKVWEQYLVYATVFGISKKVLKQLESIYTNKDFVTLKNQLIGFFFNPVFLSSLGSMSSAFASISGGGGGFSNGEGR